MGIQEELAEAIAIVNGLPSTRRGGAFVADSSISPRCTPHPEGRTPRS